MTVLTVSREPWGRLKLFICSPNRLSQQRSRTYSGAWPSASCTTLASLSPPAWTASGSASASKCPSNSPSKTFFSFFVTFVHLIVPGIFISFKYVFNSDFFVWSYFIRPRPSKALGSIYGPYLGCLSVCPSVYPSVCPTVRRNGWST